MFLSVLPESLLLYHFTRTAQDGSGSTSSTCGCPGGFDLRTSLSGSICSTVGGFLAGGLVWFA
jgi:hypothetical protein